MIVAGSLVWVKDMRGPTPEKWPADMASGGKVNKEVLAEHKLGPDEFALKLAILVQRYPAPTPAN